MTFTELIKVLDMEEDIIKSINNNKHKLTYDNSKYAEDEEVDIKNLINLFQKANKKKRRNRSYRKH